MKSRILIDCVDDGLQSAITYIYIGSMTYLFESDMTKYFLNKQNLNSYLDSICFRKNRQSSLANKMVWFFRLRLLA
jgi:hypothetical protein